MAGLEYQNVDGSMAKTAATPAASFRAGSGEESYKKSKLGVFQKVQSFMQHKVFAGKQKQRLVQNILEINQLLMENPDAVDGRNRHKKGGIFSKSKKKIHKSASKHIASNKFYILYKSKDHPEFFSSGNKQQEQEDETDRKVLYECGTTEAASYIVAKIRAQLRFQ